MLFLTLACCCGTKEAVDYAIAYFVQVPTPCCTDFSGLFLSYSF